MKKKEIEDYSIYNDNISDVDMNEYIKELMLIYGINVSMFRACSALLDGLVPVKRRMIYVFYKHGATPDKNMRKVDDLLGPVQGLHPHGPQSISGAFTNEIKWWETNAPLFEFQGNGGSITGDTAAATRYLEARLSNYAMLCFFEDFDESITEMVDSNTRSMKEPVVIPSRYPNFLLSSCVGIGWGNGISIPPYNVNEVFQLTQALIKNPKLTNVYLYPDSPRGYQIIEDPDIIDICRTGQGSIQIQAELKYHEDGHYISVKGFPEQTTMDGIMRKISELVKTGKITGIETYKDKTYLENAEFWIMLKPDADYKLIMEELYTKVSLRTHMSINMNFAGRTEMMPLGIAPALLIWIQNRIDYIQRLYIKKLSRNRERLHVIEGAITLLDPKHVNDVIDIIKTSDNDQISIERIVKKFKVTTYQANEIIDLKLNKLNKSSRAKYLEEREKILDEQKYNQSVVLSREKIKGIIIDQLDEGMKLFGRPRRCKIIKKGSIKEHEVKYMIVVTKKYIKKISNVSTNVGIVESSDQVISLFRDVPDDYHVRIMNDFGKCYCVPVSKINSNELAAKGTSLSTIKNMVGEPIKAFLQYDDIKDLDKLTLVIITKNGFIKSTPLEQYIRSNSALQGIVLNDDDRVSFMTIAPIVATTGDYKYTIIYTKNGFGISIDPSTIPQTDRLTKGSRYLAMEDDDCVQGTFRTSCEMIFVITTKGYGKICMLDDIMNTSKRRTNMIRLAGLNDGDTIFNIIPIENDNGKVMVTLQSGEKLNIQLSDVEKTTRISKGKKLVKIGRTDCIVAITLKK